MAVIIGARVGIVLVVFPVFGHAVYTTLTWTVGHALPALTIAEGWVATVSRCVTGATMAAAALASWRFCRRLWPETPFRT